MAKRKAKKTKTKAKAAKAKGIKKIAPASKPRTKSEIHRVLAEHTEIWSRVVDENLRRSRGVLGPVLELHSSDDVSEQLVSVQLPPLALGGLSELEDHRERRDARARALRSLRA